MNEYSHNGELEPYEVRDGRELVVRESQAPHNMYAGEWVRDIVTDGEDDKITLGYYDDPIRGSDEPARLGIDALLRHTLYTGVTGHGKSTAVTGILRQLAERGHGFAYFDPKGQDVTKLYQCLPEGRLDDVVWVDPGNSDPDTTVGFNFFDTHRNPDEPGFDDEVEAIVNEFVAILRQDGAWGATMDAVAKTVTTQLVRDQNANYTVLDMYQILADSDERADFAEQYGDEIEDVYLSRLKDNYEDEEFDPLLRRLRECAENRTIREMMSHRNSDISIGDVVEEGKILLVRTSSIPSAQLMQLVATTLVRRIWASIQSRPKDRSIPFFIAMDEFDIFSSPSLSIEDLVMKGGSLNLGLLISLQKLSQGDDEVERAFANIDNLFTFNPGQNNVSGASKLAQAYNCGAQRLLDLTQFEFLGRLTTNDGTLSEPLNISQFAPFPPLRSKDEVTDLIENSRKTYGESRQQKDFDFADCGLR